MRIDFLVEEPSAQLALFQILPSVLGTIPFDVFSLGSKDQLLKKLPGRLRGYAARIQHGEELVIFVLIDEDRQDCADLKRKLEAMAADAGLTTKTTAAYGKRFHVVNRIVVEELEAWFFGDVEALVQAYPGVPATLGSKSAYRDPDEVKGGTWEQLERVLQDAGYYKAGMPKTEVAETVAQYMDPDRNRSRSFQVFFQALREVVQAAAV